MVEYAGEVDASLEADVVNVAAAIMKLGDRFQVNGSLTLNEMTTFLAGTVYHEFCDWLSEPSVFGRFDANHDSMLNLTELQDAVREYLGGEPVYQHEQSADYQHEQSEQHDEVHQTLLNHSAALGNIFDTHSTEGEMRAADFEAFATDYELSPALVSIGLIRTLYTQRAPSGGVGYGEFAQLVAECAMEAFPGEDEHAETSSEERVAALMVYMGQQPNHQLEDHFGEPMHEPMHDEPMHEPMHDMPGGSAAPATTDAMQEVGLWQIANQIHCSIHDLDDNSASKQALSVPSAQLKQVLALHRIVEARELMMQSVLGGLQLETDTFNKQIEAAAELSTLYTQELDSIFSRIEPQDLSVSHT